MKPRAWPIFLWAGLGIAALLALGTWQLFRLGEKQELLAEIEARVQATPVSLEKVLAMHERGENIEFVAVKTGGTFDYPSERHKLATFDGSSGWQIITPFRSSEGIVVLVDRGAVSDDLRDAGKRPENASTIELAAIVRTHGNERGFFDPENDVDGNAWYWWDVPAMLSSVSIPADMKIAPFVLQALPGDDPKKIPRAARPEAQLLNNHLQYAITWFSLAIALFVIAGLFIRKQVSRTGP